MAIDWDTQADWAEDTIGGDKVSNVFGLAWNVVVGAYTKFIIGADVGLNALYKVEFFLADRYEFGYRNRSEMCSGSKTQTITGQLLLAAAGGISQLFTRRATVIDGPDTTVVESRTTVVEEDEVVAERQSITSEDSFHTCLSFSGSVAGLDSREAGEHLVAAGTITQTATTTAVIDAPVVDLG
jgi:hypothetical protein